MYLEVQNDLRKIERTFEILNHLAKIEYQTGIGSEVKNTLDESVIEIIRPFLLEKHKQLKSELKQNGKDTLQKTT